MKFLPNKKGQGLIGGIIGVIVGLIMIVAVAIPVIQDTITNQAFTGTTKTITDLFPILLAVGGLVLVTGGFLMSRT